MSKIQNAKNLAKKGGRKTSNLVKKGSPDNEKNENLDPKPEERAGLEDRSKMKLLVGTCVLKIRLHCHNIMMKLYG